MASYDRHFTFRWWMISTLLFRLSLKWIWTLTGNSPQPRRVKWKGGSLEKKKDIARTIITIQRQRKRNRKCEKQGGTEIRAAENPSCIWENVAVLSRASLPDFNKIIRFIAGMKEEPDFLNKMIDAGFSSGPSYIYHPFMRGMVILFSFIRRDVSGKGKTMTKINSTTSLWLYLIRMKK